MSNFAYLKKYLRDNKYYDFEKEILISLESHPDYPSLIAIVDTFNNLGIENIATRIEKNNLDALPKTFISVYLTETGSEIVYTKNLNNTIEIQFSNNFKKTITRAEYLEGWNSIVVIVDENQKATKKIIPSNKYSIVCPFFIVSLVLLSIENKDNFITATFYYLLLITGLIISFFLVREEMGLYNESVSKICNATEKTSCKDVMSSNGAKVFKNVSLSDISMLYFSSLTLFFTLTSFDSNSFIYSIIGIFSIPIILYSIYYQGFIVKKWCLLCLGIDTVLLLQLIIISFNFSLEFNFTTLISFFSGILIIVLFYFGGSEFKNRIQKINKYEITELQYQKIKRNYLVFSTLLKTNQKIDEDSLNSLSTITIGKIDSPITLFLVISASCGHCHTVYENAIKLVKKNPNEIKIKLIFNINIENTENPNNLIYKQAANYYWGGEVHKAISSLNDWHIENLDLEKWKYKWENNYVEYSTKMIPNHYDWCLENAIHYTPAIILNGHIIPKEYHINDLNYFIDGLIEEKTLVL